MNLRQMRYFVRVVELGTITRAAEALGIAQPALGLQIKQLEEELGAALLERHSRGVEPTAAGRLLFDRARAILRQVEEARRAIADLGRRPREALALGLSPSLTALLGPDLAVRCRAELPELALHLVEDLSFNLVEWVVGGRLDLALAYDVPELPALLVEPVLQEALLLVRAASANTPATATVAEVLAGELAVPGGIDSISRRLAAEAARRGIAPRVAFAMQSVAAMKRVAARGLAAAVLPYGAVADELARGELSASRIVEPRLVRQLSLVRRADHAGSTQERHLVGLLLGMARDLVPQAPAEPGDAGGA